MKGYFTFHKAVGLSLIKDSCLTPLQRYSQYILQPHPTGWLVSRITLVVDTQQLYILFKRNEKNLFMLDNFLRDEFLLRSIGMSDSKINIWNFI